MENKSQIPYLTNQNLLIAQNLWQVHYQILSIISMKEFITLNVYTDMIIKNARRVEPHTATLSAVLNTQTLKVI